MVKYSEEEIELLGIQIGCVIKLARLTKGLSQEELSLLVGSNSTNIGRIERAEHTSGWDKLLMICQQLNIDHSKLFLLKNEKSLLDIVDQSLSLEKKLNQDKKDYYTFLKKSISNKFKSLSNKTK
ncbi:DNA-binding transcriptional regulator, XRE-family HTH domain [Zhouia amylolytica]|uniref:DNA-binding transcriptional regulator, XRE-family HTH domain n=1 Tax=Zhouia amylolytica TaxID=376730 RepID=A0A1I6T3L4_9FLAO|nr:helix-turn-helix transcriptional regulator [Zhouia amylolytica]SFS83842.1 DNA-binding transcriptional regulator, XRE-family HTH domain [Zhouia amylolytica]